MPTRTDDHMLGFVHLGLYISGTCEESLGISIDAREAKLVGERARLPYALRQGDKSR